MPVRFIFAEPVATEQDTGQPLFPTLGEVIDKLAEEKPDMAVNCDPDLRDRRVGRVEVLPY